MTDAEEAVYEHPTASDTIIEVCDGLLELERRLSMAFSPGVLWQLGAQCAESGATSSSYAQAHGVSSQVHFMGPGDCKARDFSML